MKYLVCKKQHGEGCDFTIGCGMRFDFIEAETIEDAIEHTIYPDGRSESCAFDGEQALSEILVIPASEVTTVDVSSLLQQFENDKEAKKKASVTESSVRGSSAKPKAFDAETAPLDELERVVDAEYAQR